MSQCWKLYWATLSSSGRKISRGPFPESPETFSGPKSPFLKLRPPYSVKLFFFIYCKGNKNKNNCKVSCLEKPSFWRYKEYYGTRNAPEKLQDFRETGPRPERDWPWPLPDIFRERERERDCIFFIGESLLTSLFTFLLISIRLT